MKKSVYLAFICFSFLLAGCSTYHFPSPMTETEVFEKLVSVKPILPKEKIYRQYVTDGRYLQFERIDENNVIYGWYTCTDCTWTRSKFLAIYDGSYLYLTYGHHEDFFLESPKDSRKHPDFSHWSWSSILKYQIEGRNLILRGQIRKCIYDSPQIVEWDNAPWSGDGDYSCAYKNRGTYKVIYVSTIDETLIGQRSSIVGADQDSLPGDIKEKLARLKDLYEEGLITQDDYEKKRRELIDEL